MSFKGTLGEARNRVPLLIDAFGAEHDLMTITITLLPTAATKRSREAGDIVDEVTRTRKKAKRNRRARDIVVDSRPTRKKAKSDPEPEQELEPADPGACGNCGFKSHRAAFCVKTGPSGWMEACPKCDSTKHQYTNCPYRKGGEEDFIYLIYNRQRKPPVKCNIALGNVIKRELQRPGTKWKESHCIGLPYSSSFAREKAQKKAAKLWNYPYLGDPSKEAEGRTIDPSRARFTLKDATFSHHMISRQRWTSEEEQFGSRDVVNPSETSSHCRSPQHVSMASLSKPKSQPSAQYIKMEDDGC
ncbi:hypothetical protein F4808DRAFT_462871 [Astrocystis sublimbata]|nr:hypothetical protein F4808DRAFT_462871 [Astrocystis sublimbata]